MSNERFANVATLTKRASRIVVVVALRRISRSERRGRKVVTALNPGARTKGMAVNISFSVRQKRSRVAWMLAPLVVGALLDSSAQGAQAHRRDFPFTYDWKQPSKGERELELKSTYSDSTFKQEVELEFGLSKRFMVAPYLVFERERGGNLKYHEFKLETRYQLGDYKTNKILTGLYLEYAKVNRGPSELEGKLIFSRYTKKGENLSVNLIAERAFQSGEKTAFEYSIGYARPLGKNGARIGGELIHELNDNQVKAGPTVAFSLTDDVWLTAGYAFGLNKRQENKDEIRINAEYEF